MRSVPILPSASLSLLAELLALALRFDDGIGRRPLALTDNLAVMLDSRQYVHMQGPVLSHTLNMISVTTQSVITRPADLGALQHTEQVLLCQKMDPSQREESFLQFEAEMRCDSRS